MARGICIESRWYAEDVVNAAELNGVNINHETAEWWLLRNENPFLSRMAELGNEVLQVMTDGVEWSEFEKENPKNKEAETRLCECVYDISMVAAGMIATGRIYCEDSRELFHDIQHLAEEYESNWPVNQVEAAYMDDIIQYATEKLSEKYGMETWRKRRVNQ